MYLEMYLVYSIQQPVYGGRAVSKFETKILLFKKMTLLGHHTGGMAPECEAFNKQLAHRIADKRKDDYSAVANYIRTKIRFALLRSVLISLRGVRGKQKKDSTTPTSAVAFGLIPEKESYDQAY